MLGDLLVLWFGRKKALTLTIVLHEISLAHRNLQQRLRTCTPEGAVCPANIFTKGDSIPIAEASFTAGSSSPVDKHAKHAKRSARHNTPQGLSLSLTTLHIIVQSPAICSSSHWQNSRLLPAALCVSPDCFISPPNPVP